MRLASTKPLEGTASNQHAGGAAVTKRPQRVASRPRKSPVALNGPSEVGPQAGFDPDLRHRMISEAAYYLYTQRSCADGFDLDDWLVGETQIDDLIMNPEHEDTGEVSAPLASP